MDLWSILKKIIIIFTASLRSFYSETGTFLLQVVCWRRIQCLVPLPSFMLSCQPFDPPFTFASSLKYQQSENANNMYHYKHHFDLNSFLWHSDGSKGKLSACNVGDLGSIPGLGRSPRGGHGNPLHYSCLENPHGQRSMEGYGWWGRKELDTTEGLSMHGVNDMVLALRKIWWYYQVCNTDHPTPSPGLSFKCWRKSLYNASIIFLNASSSPGLFPLM